MMNVETSSLPSPLSQLLAHCEEAGLHNGILSLRQLIPVHQSLIRCMDATSSASDSSNQDTSLQLSLQGCETPTIVLSLPLALNRDEERSICEENLSTNGGKDDDAMKQDTKRLLLLQYLIQRMKLRSSTSYALKSLQFLLLPYLLQTSSTSSQDFILAVLELVDSMAVLADPTSSARNEWEAIVQQCLPSPDSTTVPRTSCRILGRLVEKLVHQQNSSADKHEIQMILVKALYDRISQVLDEALSWCSDTSTTQEQQHAILTVLLSCLSKDLLPLVVIAINSQTLSSTNFDGSSSNRQNFLISLHRSHIDDLWRHLFARFLKTIDHDVIVGGDKENPASHLQTSNSDRLVLLVLTSIFCPLLPGLVDYRLPLVEKVPPAEELAAMPFHQPLLWQLIFTSLSQGKSLALEASAGSTSASPWTNNKSPIASSSNNTRGAAPTSGSWLSSATILRKRALYMLRTLAESGSASSSEEETEDSPIRLWKTYVMCAETLNTESEQHLIDQIWGSVATLLRHVNASTDKTSTDMERGGGGEAVLNWDWMGLLLSSILSNEQTVLRKLGLYRLLKGHMGLSIVPHNIDVVALDGPVEASDGSKKKQQQQRKKKRTRNITVRGEQSDDRATHNAALDMVDPEFVLYVLLPSWDSVGASMGYNMHLEENGKVVREDMVPLMTRFLQVYIQSLQNPSNKHDAEMQTQRRRTFWHGLWSSTLLSALRLKTIALIYTSLSEELEQITKEAMTSTSMENVVPADEVLLHTMAETFEPLFQSGSVVLAYRTQFLQALAIMLKHCKCPVAAAKKWSPMTMLRLLALFTPEYFPLDDTEWNVMDDPMLQHLRVWIVDRMDTSGLTVGATVAAAFVGGYLLQSRVAWDPTFGPTRTEKELGWAIPLLCTLAVTDVQPNQPIGTASELLWPAIHKAVSTGSNIKADQTTRALLLLENGCKLRQLSGLGNGDLVVDRKTQQPMPPPPNIEAMLSNVVTFMLSHVETLVASDVAMVSMGSEDKDVRSKRSMRISHTFARLIGQLRTLQSSFPSSMAVSSAVNEVLQSSVQAFSSKFEDLSGDQKVKHAALIYAAVSSGADPRRENGDDLDSYISLCQLLSRLEVREGEVDQTWEPTARAVLQYAKWGAISCLVPLLLDSAPSDSADTRLQKVQTFLHDLLVSAFDAVKDTSETALFPLFTCVLFAGKQWVGVAVDGSRMGEEPQRSEQAYIENLQKMISALFKLMEGRHTSSNKTYMLNEFCSLIFNQKLLTDEYVRLNRNPKCPTPIRDAFRKLIDMAGPRRPHVTKSVLYRLTAGWLAIETNAEAQHISLGLSAIPYREDIVSLLLHKEMRLDESGLNQSARHQEDPNSEGIKLPSQTDDLSVTRGFLLVFLSKLPDVEKGLHPDVLKHLLHHVILQLLEEATPKNAKHISMVMKGTPLYVRKMRAWQALCTLSRFVNREIAQGVFDSTFKCLNEPGHNQIRYFMENFTINCAAAHPEIFGPAFLADISRRDLSLQHISSLMIIGGNLIVGRYKLNYFRPDSGQNDKRLRQVLASVIPWLSSTQGFSRAIAQILVHALIPLVIANVDKGTSETSLSDAESDWFLRLQYQFLNKNHEMTRLRKKQMKFFENYEVESMCTPEGVLSMPVDEGDEASPVHMVDAIKKCLQEVYQESHGEDAPEWKHVENMLQSQQQELQEHRPTAETEAGPVNFQRKIVPLDSLNLAMEDLREMRLRNAAGRKKQQLVVCATLVDKIPNLGGLARTCEIFAADRLIVPDLKVCKMDNFKSLSVGAGDWLEMEECREENLLSWLLSQKAKGYYVVGVEQTSSSVSLTEMVFPPDRPTILLLGKEKEGIPVPLLDAVDQCVEIPQLGIIRSLNVHVSGAIMIWEYTKQRLEQKAPETKGTKRKHS